MSKGETNHGRKTKQKIRVDMDTPYLCRDPLLVRLVSPALALITCTITLAFRNKLVMIVTEQK
ncbi:hypothetical protein AKJ16_DCAP06918 [Drosera capensis]